ncbi:MAG: DoxX family protein [Mycobacterium sp.]
MTSQSADSGWQRPEDDAGRPASARLVDPEDDLAGPPYGGDPETTKIASTTIASAPSPSTGYGLVNPPEPLPYVQPRPEPEPVPAVSQIAPAEAGERPGRRGTQDLGLLVLRVVLGVILIAHGLRNAFGWWGGPGLGGFADSLAEAGFQHSGLLSYLGAGGQIAAGVLLVLGLFTPLAGAVGLGLLVSGLLVAIDAQRQEGGVVILGSDRVEYLLVLTAAMAAVVLAGPGRYGFDAGRGWARRPFIGSFLALLAGIGGGVAVWLFLRGTNPFG